MRLSVERNVPWRVPGGGMVVRIALFEDFRCPHCEDFGIVEVTVGPAVGVASERLEPETEWRVCQCRQSEMPADIGGGPRSTREEGTVD